MSTDAVLICIILHLLFNALHILYTTVQHNTISYLYYTYIHYAIGAINFSNMYTRLEMTRDPVYGDILGTG